MTSRSFACAAALGFLAFAPVARADSGKDELRKSLKDQELVGTWIYDDVEAGFAAARAAAKPLLVVFR